MGASASARSSDENAAVAWVRLACRAATSGWVTWFEVTQIGVPLQNVPATVWSGVRVALVSRPRLFTSSIAAAYAASPTAGGVAGRNCCGVSSTNGVTDPQPVYVGAGNLGGVGR